MSPPVSSNHWYDFTFYFPTVIEVNTLHMTDPFTVQKVAGQQFFFYYHWPSIKSWPPENSGFYNQMAEEAPEKKAELSQRVAKWKLPAILRTYKDILEEEASVISVEPLGSLRYSHLDYYLTLNLWTWNIHPWIKPKDLIDRNSAASLSGVCPSISISFWIYINHLSNNTENYSVSFTVIHQ